MSYYKPVNGMCGIFRVSCPLPGNLLAALIKFYQCLFCLRVLWFLFISLKSLLLEILVHMSSITVGSFDGIAYGVLHDLCNIGWFLQFGYIVLTTSAGIMDHEEARRKNVGGKVLGFFY
jgi:small subunit ribosomal protein S15Ae